MVTLIQEAYRLGRGLGETETDCQDPHSLTAKTWGCGWLRSSGLAVMVESGELQRRGAWSGLFLDVSPAPSTVPGNRALNKHLLLLYSIHLPCTTPPKWLLLDTHSHSILAPRQPSQWTPPWPSSSSSFWLHLSLSSSSCLAFGAKW